MAELLDLSSRIIDSGVADVPVNRVTGELSELGDGVSIVESFSHVISVRTGEGLVTFDASLESTAPRVLESLRAWSTDPVHTLVYTHGHIDHVGGSGVFARDASERGHPRPRVVGHAAVADRFARYRLTDGYNRLINARQFGGVRSIAGMGGQDETFLPAEVLETDLTYEDHMTLEVGGLEMELRYARAETDDHTWTWIPEKSMIAAGDLVIWNFPNCGNPQKVQRYAVEWAEALREMAAVGAELLVPAHGLPIGGRDRVRSVLETTAGVLEKLVADVLDAMNSGATLDEIVHGVKVDPDKLELPYLRPLYDEPEFAVRGIWRRYGGWWDGNPAHLKPAPDTVVAAEVAALAGGADRLVSRATELAEEGDFRLACELIEWAAGAEPESATVHGARAAIYERRRKAESSLMAKGIFKGAVRQSEAAQAPEG
ncbi:MAG TPA: MBL fold metallo-hydrolase [Acidimicrobiales bacterium]|nr:MBL fold metallo-hydrolase [Acidimicrobiales bacterium]